MTFMSDWNAEQYTRFENERTQPSVDLIDRLKISPSTILDVGCGPGNSTRQLYERFKGADILGIDSSENMLEKAESSCPYLRFRKCIVPDELDGLDNFDLIFSNACLHWIPDHYTLLPALMKKVNPGGMLAVQIPLTGSAMFYKVLGKLLSEEKWSRLSKIQNFHNPPPDEIYDILLPESAEVTMWDTTYYHAAASHGAVIDWYKGSGLRPYLDMLDEDEKACFLSELLDRIKEDYPVQADGTVLLKMPRLFFIAVK